MERQPLVAGTPGLELANTVNNWHDPRHDVLDDPEQATRWAGRVFAVRVERIGEPGLADLRRLRDQVRTVFSAIAAGDQPATDKLEGLLAHHRHALDSASLRLADGHYQLTWPRLHDSPTAPFAADAFRLLTDGPLGRVGECPGCGWLFLDASRNGSRTWCSMAMCGGRFKAQRHYRRTHPGSARSHEDTGTSDR